MSLPTEDNLASANNDTISSRPTADQSAIPGIAQSTATQTPPGIGRRFEKNKIVVPQIEANQNATQEINHHENQDTSNDESSSKGSVAKADRQKREKDSTTKNGRAKEMINEETKQEMEQRAERGKEIIAANRATGAPGTPQPEHKDTSIKNQEILRDIEELEKKHAVPTRESSAKRSQSGQGNNPVPPEERTAIPIDSPAVGVAATALAAARSALTSQAESDARLLSDPRYIRDQKVFEMARAGKIGTVPPAEEEIVARDPNASAMEVAEASPKTASEQVERDMERLGEAEKRNEEIQSGKVINPAIALKDADAKRQFGDTTQTQEEKTNPTKW